MFKQNASTTTTQRIALTLFVKKNDGTPISVRKFAASCHATPKLFTLQSDRWVPTSSEIAIQEATTCPLLSFPEPLSEIVVEFGNRRDFFYRFVKGILDSAVGDGVSF